MITALAIAKAALLRCKTYAFTVQNLRFRNAKEPLLERKTIGFAKC